MKRFQVLKMMFFVLLIWTEAIYAGTYYVDVNGDNSYGDGSERHPWRTVGYAVGHVRSGDTVSINDGIYSEFQIVLPEGVSLTSTSQDNTKVKIQPNITMTSVTPFVKLMSSSLSSDGNQTISFLEIDGINGSYHAQICIWIKNRNNVKIHHNNIHDFYLGNRFCYGIRVESTEQPPGSLGSLWPYDIGLPGDDAALDAIWPGNPVKNLEINHNNIINCGRDDDSMVPYGGILAYNIKDSSIHDNYIDNTSNFGQCIYSTPAFFDNVDIYNNTLRMSTLSSRSSYIIELWCFKGGCKIYGNDVDAGFSITDGKETDVYNNTMVVPSHARRGMAMEFSNQSYAEIYDNYISGVRDGILVGEHNQNPAYDFIVKEVLIRNNTIVNPRTFCIRVMSVGEEGRGNVLVRDIKVYNNTLDGGSIDTNYSALMVQQDSAVMTDIEIKNNIIVNGSSYPGATVGTVSNLEIKNNLFWNNPPKDYWVGAGDDNTTIRDPKFVATGDRPDLYYTLQSDSPAIDAGVDVGLPYKGSAPDVGAVEYGQTEGIKPPENVMVSSSPS